MLEVYIRHGQASAETGWGLTEEGKVQAEAAAAYLRSHFSGVFKIGAHSGSRRAVETAGLLGLPGIKWSKDERLREADWGGFVPREFDRWTDIYTRVAAACGVWGSNENRVVVSHGGTMQMVRVYREALTGSRFPLLFEEPRKYFTNCQIIIYTDENPDSRIIESDKLWVKSVCPWDVGRFGHDWMRVR